MATIFYSLAGEGRGHATRVRTIVDELRVEHRIVIFAPGDAFALLAPAYAGSDVRVERIPGLQFAYAAGGALSAWRTGLRAAAFAARLDGVVRRIAAEIERERPELAIVDFEPSLPRAAALCGVPFVSVDHQHFLVCSDLSRLPANLRARASFLGAVVRALYSGQAATIVSSFCFTGLRPGLTRTLETGPLLRAPVLAARPTSGEHLLVYVRKFGSRRLTEALAATGCEVRVYGLGAQPDAGRVRFFALDEERFIEDLAGARAVVTTAGNQLLGEAAYLGKPVLAFPEPRNAEQSIHAHLLAAAGGGERLDVRRLETGDLRAFLERAPAYARPPGAPELNGKLAVLRELRRFLPRPPAEASSATRAASW